MMVNNTFKNTNDNSNNNNDNKPQNMDRAEQKRPSSGFKNYDKTNKACTTKNYLETYFLLGYVNIVTNFESALINTL
jgi:hypothetical protein